MSAYYNEIEPYAAQWLRNLIAAGHIAAGDVDERSIVDVRPDDLRGYTQCHFFAGIGGWSYALRLAGWPDDRPVWTGSCPCQPFSAAGKQRGSDDERHLWPAFFGLIRECRPAVVFGEQVAGAAGLAWLDHVCADLEGAGYAAAAANLGAHSVGAPHIRQRLYWVANASDFRSCQAEGRRGAAAQQAEGRMQQLAGACDACRRFFERYRCNAPDECDCPRCQCYCECGMGYSDEIRPSGSSDAGSGKGVGQPWAQPAGTGAEGLLMGNAESARSQGQRRQHRAPLGNERGRQPGLSGEAWADLEWLPCRDGKLRPTQPGIFPLAHGVSGRVGRLRAYGNAIVPQVAAAFIEAAQGG